MQGIRRDGKDLVSLALEIIHGLLLRFRIIESELSGFGNIQKLYIPEGLLSKIGPIR